MTTVKIRESGILAVMVDGYLLSGDVQTFQGGGTSEDDSFVLSISRRFIEARYDKGVPNSNCDIYVVKPLESSRFPSKYSPIHEDVPVSAPKRNLYRLVIAVGNELTQEHLQKTLSEALESLGFEPRDQVSYSNVTRFQEYARDLLREIADIYAGPHVITTKMLSDIGLVSVSETI